MQVICSRELTINTHHNTHLKKAYKYTNLFFPEKIGRRLQPLLLQRVIPEKG